MVETREFLKKRRSVLARNMTAPGPDDAQLRELLSIAARVPDHGKLAPWRFVVLQGVDRAKLGHIAATALGDDSVAVHYERAPCVVAVLACPKEHPKIPRSEMILSAGAACMNLLTGRRQWDLRRNGYRVLPPMKKLCCARFGGRRAMR